MKYREARGTRIMRSLIILNFHHTLLRKSSEGGCNMKVI
jgi:hypothetical protein